MYPWRKRAGQVPYFDLILTSYSGFILGSAVYSGYADPYGIFIQDPEYLEYFKSNEYIRYNSLLIASWILVGMVGALFAAELYTTIHHLRKATKVEEGDINLTKVLKHRLCGAWCLSVISVLLMEVMLYSLLGKYLTGMLVILARLGLIWVVRKFMEELKQEVRMSKREVRPKPKRRMSTRLRQPVKLELE